MNDSVFFVRRTFRNEPSSQAHPVGFLDFTGFVDGPDDLDTHRVWVLGQDQLDPFVDELGANLAPLPVRMNRVPAEFVDVEVFDGPHVSGKGDDGAVRVVNGDDEPDLVFRSAERVVEIVVRQLVHAFVIVGCCSESGTDRNLLFFERSNRNTEYGHCSASFYPILYHIYINKSIGEKKPTI